MAEKKSRVQGLKIFLVWANVTVGLLALACVVVAGSLVGYSRLYENRYFPGTRILGVRLDGLTRTEAQKQLQDAVDSALSKGLHFSYHGHDIALDATTVSSDPDASRDLVRFDFNTALDKAFELGRGSGWQQDTADQLRLRVYPVNIQALVTIDRATISDALNSSLKDDLADVRNASLTINTSSTHPAVTIEPERVGKELIVDPALDELQHQAESLNFSPIDLSDKAIKPTVTMADLEPATSLVFAYLNRPSLTFTYDKSSFPVPTSTLASWVNVTGTPGNIDLTLDPEKFAAGLKALAKGVEVDGKSGGLVVKDGKVQSFVPGTAGTVIDAQGTLNQVLTQWPASSTFPILIKTIPAALVGEDPEKLGIRDLLGTGYSKFSGSPANRRKNIARGTELINGQIIQPDQVFSVVDAVGPVDGAHGWFAEMVIKGDHTLPEFGGGLCQIGTTVFRAAMKSGLPILERQNHSYRVGLLRTGWHGRHHLRPASGFALQERHGPSDLHQRLRQRRRTVLRVLGHIGRAQRRDRAVAYLQPGAAGAQETHRDPGSGARQDETRGDGAHRRGRGFHLHRHLRRRSSEERDVPQPLPAVAGSLESRSGKIIECDQHFGHC